MEKKMEMNIMGYKGTTTRIPFFIQSYPKVRRDSSLQKEVCCAFGGSGGLSKWVCNPYNLYGDPIYHSHPNLALNPKP